MDPREKDQVDILLALFSRMVNNMPRLASQAALCYNRTNDFCVTGVLATLPATLVTRSMLRRRANYHSPKSQARLKIYYQQPEVLERKNACTSRRYYDPVIGPHVQEQKRARTLNYIARKKAVQGTYTSKQIQEQLKRQKHRCYYAACGFAKFEKKKGKYVYHIGHTFPLSRVVGTDIPANSIDYLVLACPTCNMNKKNKFPWEWSEGGRLL